MRVRGHRGHFSAWRLYFIATLKRPYFLSFSPTVRVCVRAHIIDQGLVCLIRSIDSNMADLGLHITLLPISRQALPSSAATCQNQLLVLQIGLCLFLYVFPVFEHLSVLFCSVLLFLANQLFSLFSCATSKHFILYTLLCLDLAHAEELSGNFQENS